MAQTTKEILSELKTVLAAGYEGQLTRLPLKHPVRRAMVDGFKDGTDMIVKHLINMGVIEVIE